MATETTGKVMGKDCIFYIWDAPIWKPYVCARSGSFEIVTDILETSVAGTGVWRTHLPTANSWSASFSGIISLMITGTLSIADLQLLQTTQTMLLLRYQETSRAGDVYTKEGYAIITRSSENASFDNIATFDIDLVGSGALTRIFTPTPNPSNTCKVKRFDYTFAGGEDTFSSALLYNKDVLEIVKDGLGKADIITSGTPVGTEAKYYQITGSFNLGAVQFPQYGDPGERAYVLYQDI